MSWDSVLILVLCSERFHNAPTLRHPAASACGLIWPSDTNPYWPSAVVVWEFNFHFQWVFIWNHPGTHLWAYLGEYFQSELPESGRPMLGKLGTVLCLASQTKSKGGSNWYISFHLSLLPGCSHTVTSLSCRPRLPPSRGRRWANNENYSLHPVNWFCRALVTTWRKVKSFKMEVSEGNSQLTT